MENNQKELEDLVVLSNLLRNAKIYHDPDYLIEIYEKKLAEKNNSMVKDISKPNNPKIKRF